MNSYIKYSIAEEKQNILNYLRKRKTKLNEDGIIELGLFGSFAKDEADLANDVIAYALIKKSLKGSILVRLSLRLKGIEDGDGRF
ncbi:hypothetical protein ABV837_001052 [Campylobacter upsaliensis]|uniref:hypothetical protein n=1 Tax=Campylobacter helveticus TaxID=28898 RepID=UPI0011127757|nr:hypothetical protein [Campylobacter helveticus]EAH5552936.1 hypothetical protein [Campylobacter upsaliensis]EAH8208340.1 hypothetical protein [Campylobacter upsaliensis]EAH8338406.1 hypothetical protein [Campylobacter upsaliensis]EAI0665681.1 hypothetical protein [Campylobacter upsaliensis]EAJ7578912.1 hypothetical protein [Campylobacter upsaliensis]